MSMNFLIKKTSLHSQAHWLVAKKNNTRPKPVKELAYTSAPAQLVSKVVVTWVGKCFEIGN